MYVLVIVKQNDDMITVWQCNASPDSEKHL